jgi:hypothetical protein
MHIALPKSRGGDKLPPSEQRIAFLTANCDPSLGYVGGYLLTTARGRPIEFHYTTPVNPSATHRILYGAELEPYILAELIGSSLVRQCTTEAAFIVTDQPHMLSQRKSWSCPIVCVVCRPTTAQGPPATEQINLIRDMHAHPDYLEDVAALNRWLEEVNPGLSLDEPFVRVWEALREISAAATRSQAA